MRVLLTGGAGYIGSVLIPELLRRYKVRVLDNLTYGYDGIIPHLGNQNFEFVRGDIRDASIIKKTLKDIDFVIHLAAIVGYPACKARPELSNEINYLGTKNLVNQCSIPIIFASSGSNYGIVEAACDEETQLNPLTEYGWSKVKAEEEIQKNSDYIIYRFSTGFGLSPRIRLDLLVNDFLFKAMKNKELIIYEKDYWRSFIHVKDMAESLIFALENFEKMNHEIYNIGNETLCLTKEDVALKIKNYVDYYLKFAGFGTDPDQRNYKVSFKKIRSIGFKTKYDLDYGIREMIKAFEFIEPKECYYNNRVFK
ncbi:MAG: NAD-dependent epimerase/dehydratase family protein [Euryarchaeota archaeon]|nr:NAD-dependent epimerase/dehydratase family protein [Euryarchaeota archaeon]